MGFLVSVLLSALGGIAAGLGAARLIRGNMTGGLLGGMTGAMAVYFYLHPASDGNWLPFVLAFLRGVAGGAVLGLIGALMMRKKT